MTERRFTEEEVAEILKNAVELQDSGKSLPTSRAGLTLAELQEIGREVGIAPEVIQQAARRIEPRATPMRSVLGLPLGVGRTVELDRTLTDDEWARLVVDLRDTFNARGVVRQDGLLRSWSNGNLHVLLEPTPTGQRLRLRTLNGTAKNLMVVSTGIFTATIVMAISAAISGTIGDPGFLGTMASMGSSGAIVFTMGALRLPGWARTRKQQMDEIADRVSEQIVAPRD